MTMPRIFSLTALAASLFFIIMTIAQAASLPTAPMQNPVVSEVCLAIGGR